MTRKNQLAENTDKQELSAALLEEMEQDAKVGFEDTTADDYAIPYLSVANALTKALKTSAENHVPGLQQGHIYDDVAGRRYTEVDVVPVHRQRLLVEWDDRQFVGRYPYSPEKMAETTKGDKNEDLLPNGNTLVDTFYLYALILDDDGPRPIVISFAKSSLKVYKRMMARARRLTAQGKNGPFTPPLYSHSYRLGTVEATSKKGDDYWTWTLRDDPKPVDAAVYRLAKELHEQVSKGERSAAEPQDDVITGNGADDI